MKQFSEQLQKKSQKIRLTTVERAELRDRLTTYMEYHPLPARMKKVAVPKAKTAGVGISSEPFKVFRFNATLFRTAVPTLALIMMVSVPVLAEQSAPGDMLYPVKVSFNEEVRSQLASSPYEQIEWEASRIERRIAEARLLASEGKLTEEMEAEVAEAVKEQTAKTKEKIAALKSADADEGAIAEISFASTLAVQSEMLDADVDADGSRDPEEAGAVLAILIAEESDAADAAQEQSTPSYDKLLARLEAETTNAEELFASIKRDAKQSEVADIERRLSDIARKVEKARLQHAEGEVGAVAEVEVAAAVSASSSASAMMAVKKAAAPEKTDVMLLREAMTDARKLISFMTNIDVRSSMTVEELVPIDATDDERWVIVTEVTQDAKQLQKRVAEVTIDDEKLQVGIEQFARSLEKFSSSVENKDLDAAETLATELLVLMVDIDRMMVVEVEPEEVTEVVATSTEEVEEVGSSTPSTEILDLGASGTLSATTTASTSAPVEVVDGEVAE